MFHAEVIVPSSQASLIFPARFEIASLAVVHLDDIPCLVSSQASAIDVPIPFILSIALLYFSTTKSFPLVHMLLILVPHPLIASIAGSNAPEKYAVVPKPNKAVPSAATIPTGPVKGSKNNAANPAAPIAPPIAIPPQSISPINALIALPITSPSILPSPLESPSPPNNPATFLSNFLSEPSSFFPITSPFVPPKIAVLRSYVAISDINCCTAFISTIKPSANFFIALEIVSLPSSLVKNSVNLLNPSASISIGPPSAKNICAIVDLKSIMSC